MSFSAYAKDPHHDHNVTSITEVTNVTNVTNVINTNYQNFIRDANRGTAMAAAAAGCVGPSHDKSHSKHLSVCAARSYFEGEEATTLGIEKHKDNMVFKFNLSAAHGDKLYIGGISYVFE